jgi:hypothetical protein
MGHRSVQFTPFPTALFLGSDFAEPYCVWRQTSKISTFEFTLSLQWHLKEKYLVAVWVVDFGNGMVLVDSTNGLRCRWMRTILSRERATPSNFHREIRFKGPRIALKGQTRRILHETHQNASQKQFWWIWSYCNAGQWFRFEMFRR